LLRYTDNRYEGLSSMALAIKHAKNSKNIVSLSLDRDRPAPGQVRHGAGEEEYTRLTTDLYATVHKGPQAQPPTLHRKTGRVSEPDGTLPSQEALRRLAIEEPSLDSSPYMTIEHRESLPAGATAYNHESRLAKLVGAGDSPLKPAAAPAPTQQQPPAAAAASGEAKYDHESRLAKLLESSPASAAATAAPTGSPAAAAPTGSPVAADATAAASASAAAADGGKYSHKDRLARVLGVGQGQGGAAAAAVKASAPTPAAAVASAVAASKPKYGGATSWVTSAPPVVSAASGLTKKKDAKVVGGRRRAIGG